MMSKWLLGVLAALGLGAGLVLAGPPHGHPPTFGSAAEADQLYQRAVALNAQESHLQQLLDFAHAELALPHATESAPQAVLVAASPPAGPAKASVVAPAVVANPGVSPNPAATTTTTAPPTATTASPSTTTTTTVPPTTTTTAPPATTTTTRPSRGGDGGGGSDD